MFLEYIKKLGEESTRGGHLPSTRVEGAPYPPGRAPCLVGHLEAPQCPSSGIWCLFPWKNHKESVRTKRRRLEAEPWRNQSRAPAELFYRGNIPLGGGNRRRRHHHRSSHQVGVNLHQQLHQHHLLSNCSSSLVSDLCLKTLDRYMWVTSSADYSL